MNVDNIYDLLNKFDKEEDRISAAFGFLLKQNRKLLRAFLQKIKISSSDKELKRVDIETQISYDSNESRIDLQIKIYGKFLVFLESKIVKSEDSIINQLNKYAKVLNSLKDQYNNQIRLVYISKFRIGDEKKESIISQINLNKDKIGIFYWEDLQKLVNKYGKGELYKQFDTYMGDKMYSKKTIKEQKIKDIIEVLVIHTNEENWQLINKKKIAVQANSTPDAQYIAFYRTHRKDKKGNKLPQAIDHIADVVSTQINVPRSETVKGIPALEKWYQQKNVDFDGTHKYYNLGKIVKLSREIPFLKGGKTIGQVKFKTKMSELLRAKTISDLIRLKD